VGQWSKSALGIGHTKTLQHVVNVRCRLELEHWHDGGRSRVTRMPVRVNLDSLLFLMVVCLVLLLLLLVFTFLVLSRIPDLAYPVPLPLSVWLAFVCVPDLTLSV
jgi:hypothetical protein